MYRWSKDSEEKENIYIYIYIYIYHMDVAVKLAAGPPRRNYPRGSGKKVSTEKKRKEKKT